MVPVVSGKDNFIVIRHMCLGEKGLMIVAGSRNVYPPYYKVSCGRCIGLFVIVSSQAQDLMLSISHTTVWKFVLASLLLSISYAQYHANNSEKMISL